MTELPVVVWLPAALCLVIVPGAVSLFWGRRSERSRAVAEGRSGAQLAERHLAEARRAAETERTKLILSGKEELIRAREAWEQETSGRREEIERVERRLDERTGLVDRKLDTLEQRERVLAQREQAFGEKDAQVRVAQEEARPLLAVRQKRLESLAGMTAHEFRSIVADWLATGDDTHLANRFHRRKHGRRVPAVPQDRHGRGDSREQQPVLRTPYRPSVHYAGRRHPVHRMP